MLLSPQKHKILFVHGQYAYIYTYIHYAAVFVLLDQFQGCDSSRARLTKRAIQLTPKVILAMAYVVPSQLAPISRLMALVWGNSDSMQKDSKVLGYGEHLKKGTKDSWETDR